MIESDTITPSLIDAAQAVVDRWDSPVWKDSEHTAVFIDRLRRSLAAERERAARAVPTGSSDDVKVLELAVVVVTRALDVLVGECLDADGKPKAPDRGALMRARAMLPPVCKHALPKKA